MKQQIKLKRSIAIVLCVCTLSAIILSLFCIIEKTNHNCSGEHCPICAQIQEVKNTLKQLLTGFCSRAFFICAGTALFFRVIFYGLSIKMFTPVSLKVRINH